MFLWITPDIHQKRQCRSKSFWGKKKRTGCKFGDHQSVIRPFRLPKPSVVNNSFSPESSMLSSFLHGISTVFSWSVFTVVIKERGRESWPLALPSELSSDLHQFIMAISFSLSCWWLAQEWAQDQEWQMWSEWSLAIEVSWRILPFSRD